MSMAMMARIQALEEEIRELKAGRIEAAPPPSDLEARVKDLENKYRMMNARISRKE